MVERTLPVQRGNPMTGSPFLVRLRPAAALGLLALPGFLPAQPAPYDVYPPANPPYHRIRYEASSRPGELALAANYTVWVPPGVKSLRGVIVHQHGCGEGSCKSGLTGAYDLHWQALAKRHDCALLAPAYEQPQAANCQLWSDPRNGSAAAFQQALVDLGGKSGHPELARVPWALWGHSGGGSWAGGMVLLFPERIIAAWLRSGVPLLQVAENKPAPFAIPAASLQVPVMCNLGTKEGVTDKEGRFAGVWPGVQNFFNTMRAQGALIGVAVDPLTSHECGNQRYLAIPWLDACLGARLPAASGALLHPMPTDHAWLAPLLGPTAVPAATYVGAALQAVWLPNAAMARAWMQYVKDTAVVDLSPPPAPTHLRSAGNALSWEAGADLESGLAGFIIERDGEVLARLPEEEKNPFGRSLFQNLQYSDTPTQPLVPMRYVDTTADSDRKHTYRVRAVNTVGLSSPPSAGIVASPPVPRLAGPWIQLTGRPPLERWATPKAEPVDFTIFRATDGRWQLIACVRNTSHPGKGRLLYRWSSERLATPAWRADGIFLESRADRGNAEGLLQAPHAVWDAGVCHLFYNSAGAQLLTSPDGLAFTPFQTATGKHTLFAMGRDVMLFDDRPRRPRWIAYYTATSPGLNPRTRDHTVCARTAPTLAGPWSEAETDLGTLSDPPAGYLFAYAESPFVLYRHGWYYRLEQLNVYASRDPLRWSGPCVTRLIPKDPMRYLAPEIVTDDGRDYIAAYGWRGDNPRGVFLAPLEWVER